MTPSPTGKNFGRGDDALAGNRLVALSRPFRTDRIDLVLPEGLTIAAMLEAAGVTLPPGTTGLLCIDDWVIPPELWHRVRPRPGRVVSLRVVPGGGGGGGKNPLRALLMVVVIVASFYTGGAAAAALSAAGYSAAAATAGGMVASAAVSIVGNLLVNAIAPPPAPRLDRVSGAAAQAATSPSYALTGSSNAPTPYGPIPRVFGRHKVYPPAAARPYTELVGDDQYLRALYCVGHGPLLIEDIRIGDTPITDFADVELEVREGYASDPPRALYGNSTLETQVAVQLTAARGWSQRTTADEADEIAVDLAFPRGLVEFSDQGSRIGRTVRFEVQYAPAGTDAWQAAPIYMQDAYVVEQVSWQVMASYDGFAVNDPVNYRAFYADTGQPYSGEDGWPHFADEGGGWVWSGPALRFEQRVVTHLTRYRTIVGFIDISDVRPDPIRRGARWAVVRGRYDVRLRRATGDSASDRVFDQSWWTVLRTIRHVDPIVLTGVATIALRIKASATNNGTIQQLSCLATSILPDWTGAGWGPRPTRNPAAVYLEVLRGRANARPLPDRRIDFEALQAWHAYCAASGWTFDAVFDTECINTRTDLSTCGPQRERIAARRTTSLVNTGRRHPRCRPGLSSGSTIRRTGTS